MLLLQKMNSVKIVLVAEVVLHAMRTVSGFRKHTREVRGNTVYSSHLCENVMEQKGALFAKSWYGTREKGKSR